MEGYITKILDFWFGRLEGGFTKKNRGSLWYLGGEETDTRIREEFGFLVEKAAHKKLDEWKTTPEGRLALIILLDQFTRNMYRKTKQAFQHDSYAQELCREGIEKGQDKKLPFIQRLFFYHPLEHSENLEDQELGVKMMAKVREEVPEAFKKRVQKFVDYAKQHRDIIKRFGRFPHRNKVMERISTKEERDYLKEGSRFGQ